VTTKDTHEQLLSRVDRAIELLTDIRDARARKAAKQNPADGVYTVTIPPASRAWAYWEAKQIEAQRDAGVYDDNLMPAVLKRVAEAGRRADLSFPDLRHVATFQRTRPSATRQGTPPRP